jgi:hypothetical protein
LLWWLRISNGGRNLAPVRQEKKKAVSQVTGPVRSALAGADKMKVLINKEAQSSRSSKALDVVHPF